MEFVDLVVSFMILGMLLMASVCRFRVITNRECNRLLSARLSVKIVCLRVSVPLVQLTAIDI